MPDTYKERTNLGKIIIPENVIAEIVASEVNNFKGKVLLTNSKGKRPSFVSRTIGNTDISNIEVTFENNIVDIKLYVMIRFGISISKTVDQLIDNIKRKIESSIGVVPKSVSIVVTGTISKHVVKRNIEVRKKYDVNE
ncbi:MAG: Asp23/Gls24 family envelope stress response protein [Anaerovoracaceae bacterium]